MDLRISVMPVAIKTFTEWAGENIISAPKSLIILSALLVKNYRQLQQQSYSVISLLRLIVVQGQHLFLNPILTLLAPELSSGPKAWKVFYSNTLLHDRKDDVACSIQLGSNRSVSELLHVPANFAFCATENFDWFVLPWAPSLIFFG
jgi:hypothetical protein